MAVARKDLVLAVVAAIAIYVVHSIVGQRFFETYDMVNVPLLTAGFAFVGVMLNNGVRGKGVTDIESWTTSTGLILAIVSAAATYGIVVGLQYAWENFDFLSPWDVLGYEITEIRFIGIVLAVGVVFTVLLNGWAYRRREKIMIDYDPSV